MTELQKVQHQLNNALSELMKVNLNENELLYDYIFEAHRLVKKLTIPDVMHSVFTIHSTENDDIIKVVGTKDKAIKEVKEFKDGHAYADFYWQEQVLK